MEVGASQEPLGTPEAKFAARRLSLLLFLACLAPACLALLGFAVVGGSPPALLSIGVAAGCIAVALLLISGMIRAAEAARRGRAEAALTESEKRLRLAQDAAGVGVWEIDLANGGTHQSPQSARLFDLDPRADGIYGSADFADRVGNDQLEALLAAIAAAGEARGPLDTTLRLVRRDGAVRWIRLHGDYDRAEDRPRLLGLAIDVTREHETQAQIRDAHDKLLRVARLSAMGAMASTIAHELNQPLSAIASYMEGRRAAISRGGARGRPTR
ncbi:MAG: PAS domain S-box protein [Sphingomonas sp.]